MYPGGICAVCSMSTEFECNARIVNGTDTAAGVCIVYGSTAARRAIANACLIVLPCYRACITKQVSEMHCREPVCALWCAYCFHSAKAMILEIIALPCVNENNGWRLMQFRPREAPTNRMDLMRILATSSLLACLSMPALAANEHYQDGDLLSVHWDSSYDYDDLQAMPATREIIDAYPDVDYLVVNGTKSYLNDGIVDGSSDVMRMVFPDGLDAFHNLGNSKHQVADRWQQVLDAGGTVHVAEGGPSDFTAMVIRELRSRNVGNLDHIRLVQHSQWNENKTDNDSLSFVQRFTTYVKIEDGNQSNATAWLRTSGNQVAAFQRLVEQSDHAHVWNTAFQFVTNPKRVVDFSDVVEVLEILDIPTRDVADAFEFGDRFFGKGTPGDPGPALPEEPEEQDPSEPSDPEQPYESNIAVYGENLQQARANYRRATSLTRVDCDPAGSGYICASFNNPTLADLNVGDVPVDEPDDVGDGPDEDTDTGTPKEDSDRFAIYGDSLSEARRAYARATDLPRVDCDPSGTGYICASFDNPVLADIGDTTDEAPEAAMPEQPSDDTDQDSGSGSGSGSDDSDSASSSLRFEPEYYQLGEGWVKDTARAGYSGAGYIRWTGGNQYNIRQAGKGIMKFALTPESSGTYTLQLRSRALNPAASDLNNDVWLRLDGSEWMKIFNTGKDEWRVGGKVDASDRRYVFKPDLVKGRSHTLEISGRSNGFAIDYIELVK